MLQLVSGSGMRRYGDNTESNYKTITINKCRTKCTKEWHLCGSKVWHEQNKSCPHNSSTCHGEQDGKLHESNPSIYAWHSSGSLIVEGWIQWKPCWVIIDNNRLIRHSRTTREEASTETTQFVKEALSNDSSTAGTEDLGVRHWRYGRFHTGVRCPGSLRRVCGPRRPPSMTESGGGNTVETWRPVNVFPALTGLQRIDSGSMWKGGNGKVTDSPEWGQRPYRT